MGNYLDGLGTYIYWRLGFQLTCCFCIGSYSFLNMFSVDIPQVRIIILRCLLVAAFAWAGFPFSLVMEHAPR